MLELHSCLRIDDEVWDWEIGRETIVRYSKSARFEGGHVEEIYIREFRSESVSLSLVGTSQTHSDGRSRTFRPLLHARHVKVKKYSRIAYPAGFFNENIINVKR